MRLVIPVSGVHRGIIDAMDLAQSISKDITAVYIELEPGSVSKCARNGNAGGRIYPWLSCPHPIARSFSPLLDYLDEDDRQHNDGTLAAVVLPEFIPARWWQQLLHNQTSLLIKAALLYRRRTQGFQRIIIDVPYHLKK